MTTLREAAEQALEAWDQPSGINYIDFRPYMDTLRAALAEPVQEPVAWIDDSGHPKHLSHLQSATERRLYGPLRPLYTAPPQRDEWTDADADAARLAMELEALLLDTKDTAAVSRWWDSANDALELHRQRLASPSMDALANHAETSGSPLVTPRGSLGEEAHCAYPHCVGGEMGTHCKQGCPR